MTDEKPYELRSGQQIIEALDKAARGVQAASDELSRLTAEFYSEKGVGLRFKIAVDEEKLAIYEGAIGREERPPPADIREAMAEKRVRDQDPVRWSEYQAQKSRIEALKIWISSLKAAISANQSLRKEMGDNL